MANIVTDSQDINSPAPTSSATATSSGTTSSGPTNPVQPELKVQKTEHALPVMQTGISGVKPKEEMSSPEDVPRRTLRMSSDSSSAASGSASRIRRARAALEIERAQAEHAAAKVRIAKAELEIIEAEESLDDDLVPDDDGPETPELPMNEEKPEPKDETEESHGSDTPRLPEPSAPAVVIPTPMNRPTIYHDIGDDDNADGHDKEVEPDNFYQPENVKEENECKEREKIDAEYELLHRARQRLSEDRAILEFEAERQEAENVAALHEEARMLQARLEHEAQMSRVEVAREAAEARQYSYEESSRQAHQLDEARHNMDEESSRRSHHIEEAMRAEELRLNGIRARFAQEIETKAMEVERIRADEMQRLREEQLKMQAEMAAAKSYIQNELNAIEVMKRDAAKALDRANQVRLQAEMENVKPSTSQNPKDMNPKKSNVHTLKPVSYADVAKGDLQSNGSSSMVFKKVRMAEASDESPSLPPPSGGPPGMPPSGGGDGPPGLPKKEVKEEEKGDRKKPNHPGDDDPDDDDGSSSNQSEHHDPPVHDPHLPMRGVAVPAYKVKAEATRLSHWPTTLQFPAWRRSLRSAVAGASDHPLEATRWIFEVEMDGKELTDFAADPADPFRALDAKLADALNRITRGEPARKIGIEAEKAALNMSILTGRQHLLLIYREFRRGEEESDEVAYTNLEAMEFSGQDAHLEQFLITWDTLMMSFRTPPTPMHLYSALLRRLRKCAGLKLTVEHLDRQVPGHPDRNYDFLMTAARRLVERKKSEKQTLEYSKIFKTTQGLDVPALPVLPGDANGPKGKGKGKGKNDTQPKTGVRVCFKMRDTGNCPDGSACKYSHDRELLAKARKEKKERDAKRTAGKESSNMTKPCKFFNTAAGCKKGAACTFLHEKMAPAMIAETMAAIPTGQKPTKGDGMTA